MLFLDPGRATWLLMLPLAASLWLVHLRAKRRFRAAAASSAAVQRLSRLTSARHDAVLLAAALAGLGLLVVAAMRPQVRVEARLPEYERQDLVVILDRSASMRADDVLPSRFTRAVDEVKAFLVHKPEEIHRVALVAFAGSSLTISRPTRDTASLLFFLDWIREDATPHFGTDIAAALASAREVAHHDDAGTRKVFLLLSDGDDHGPRLEAVLDQLRRERIRVHCLGIGSSREMPIPIGAQDGATEYLRDDGGRLVLTRFDPQALRGVAGLTGGRYLQSTTGRELRTAMEQVAAGERRQVGWRRSTEYRDAHRPLLLLALAATILFMVRT
jgi:Ca-activated chloride channel family protein